MTIKIENGRGHIDISSDGFTTCLKIKKPVALDWYDCAGSSGKYFAFTSNYEKPALQFNEVLTNGNDDQILKTISEFLQLFASGQYKISIETGKKDNEIHFQYKEGGNANFSYSYYNPAGENLMFTQSAERINTDSVKYYENLILNQIKPKALVFQAFFKDQGTYKDGSRWVHYLDSPMFILDGHHKLLAYKNLNLFPELVVITKETEGKIEFTKNEDLYFDYEFMLTDDLKQHIISHAPRMITGNTDKARQYNMQFDNCLKQQSRLGTDILALFKKAYQSKEPHAIKWLISKLDILNNRQPDFYLHYLEKTAEYPNGIWRPVNIRTHNDLNTWAERMFGENYDQIKAKPII
jgi:hypothetical protein